MSTQRVWRGLTESGAQVEMVATRFDGPWDDWTFRLNGASMRSVYEGPTLAHEAREITEAQMRSPLTAWAEVPQ